MIETFLFQNALSDFARPRRVTLWVLVAIAVMGIGFAITTFNTNTTPAQAYDTLSAIFIYRILALAAAIFSTAVISQEVEQKTIVYLVTRPVPRWKILLMRTFASMLVVFCICAVSAVAVSLGTYRGHFLSNPQLWRDILTFAVGSMAYGALFVLVSLLWNRAMIICLLFAFGWETSVPNLAGKVYYLSVASYLSNIGHHVEASTGPRFVSALAGQASSTVVPEGVAWIVLICLIGVCLGLGMLWFTDHEYLPREDAE